MAGKTAPWAAGGNAAGAAVRWQFTAEGARTKPRRLSSTFEL